MDAIARTVALTGVDEAVRVGASVYRGFSVRETAGAVAVLRIHDGTSAAGTLLDTIALAANASASAWYGDGGIWASNGVFVDVVSGAVEGSVRIG
jgi:hypothetical protein